MLDPVVVLKFGSSVLRSPEHLPDAVHEIYRRVREGRAVIAIVSAFEGVTAQLLRNAEPFGTRPNGHALASLASTGEQSAAALLALALEEYGVPARLIDPGTIGMVATGPPLEAVPVSLDVSKIQDLLAECSVLVLPGFFAANADGRCVLLGRGGSDHSAIFVAERLGADCTLLKDVQGIYDRDPREVGPSTHCFESISWTGAAAIAGKLVQPKALEFARDRKVEFSVSAPSFPGGTRVGNRTGRVRPLSPTLPPLRVTLLGLGTVGLGVYRELKRRPDQFEICRIAVRHPSRHIAAGIDPHLLTTDLCAAASDPVDLLIELTGAGDAAGTAIELALAAGRHVVTASKALVAARIETFEALAASHAGTIRYSAAVGGAVPMIEAVTRIAADFSDPIVSIRGIVNGTCNFVLGQLDAGASLDDAIALAQALGYAEADPAADLSGADAAAKLSLLVRCVLGGAPPLVPAGGIDQSAAARSLLGAARGERLTLVASFRRSGDRFSANVGLEELPATDWLVSFRDHSNALLIERQSGWTTKLCGLGAGRSPTTAAVIADVYDIWRERLSADAKRQPVN